MYRHHGHTLWIIISIAEEEDFNRSPNYTGIEMEAIDRCGLC